MPSRKVIANLIALAGSVAAGYALHGLMLTGSCGGTGLPECPSGASPYFVAMAVGLPAAIFAGILGGRAGALALFPAIGIGSLWAAFGLQAEPRAIAFILGGIFLAVGAWPLAFLPFARRKQRLMATLVAEGGQAIGTVTNVRDTGVTINNNPRVVLGLRIEPVDGSPAFDGEKTITVSRVKLPYQGQRFPVWYDRADPTTFGLGFDVSDEAPPAVRALFARAAQANPAPSAAGGPAAEDRSIASPSSTSCGSPAP